MKTFFLSILFLITYQTLACSCGGFDRISLKDLLYYDFIFESRIISNPNIVRDNSGFEKKEFQVLVIKKYFGHNSQDTLTVSTGLGSSDCGLGFKKGEKWLIFSNSGGNIYYSSSCSKSVKSNSISYQSTKRFLAKYQSKTKYVKDKVQRHKIQGDLKNGNPNGRWLITKDLDTVEIINFSNGLLDGKWIKYHERGESRSIWNYKRGIRNGLYEYYNEQGILRTRISYLEGKKDGSSVEYYDSGKLYRTSEYSSGIVTKDQIFALPEEESKTYSYESIDFTSFKKELILTLNKPDLKWAIPNSILVSPDNKYFLISYDFNPTFFELYETDPMRKIKEFKTRGHSYLSYSFFHNGSIYIDIGKRINIGQEKTQFVAFDIATGQMERVKCEVSPLGCEYPISSPFRNEILKEYITSDQRLMFKVENSEVNVYQITK
jgi:antitoxin component YwqK of YwqJK toxin-antitoxin module